MIRLSSILVIPFIVMTACVDPGQSLMQPVSGHSSSWHDSGDSEDICREYLVLLGGAQSMHYGMYNEYGDNIEDLQEFLQIPVESIYCPVNGEYLFSGDINDEYYIECPSDVVMSHGHIWNGFVSWPPDPSEYLEFCRSNMRSLASACAMYYGMYSCYPDSIEDLQEFFSIPVDSIHCPVNGEYIFSGDDENYCIACPSNETLSHGNIVNGTVSWPPDPSDYLEICRSNMRCLATACAMYYGYNNRYPEVLSDLEEVMENWDLECPAYASIYLYETNQEGDSYTLTCPLPLHPNHGCFVDGYPNW